MKKALKAILIGLGLILVGTLLYAAVSPADFRIARKHTYAKPAGEVFRHFNSSKLANIWNPFLAQDPNTKITYAGPDEGVGSSSSWESEKMGSGTSTITESNPNQNVKVNLEFRKPFAGTNLVEYKFEE